MAKSIGKFIGTVPLPRKGMPNPKLSESEFKARYKEQFIDPAFEMLADEIEDLVDSHASHELVVGVDHRR